MSQPERPLLSVVTPTYARHDLLLETVEEVAAQDYPNLEHIIVTDGPDPELRRRLWSAGHRPADPFYDGGPSRLTFLELGRNWSTFIPNNFGIGPIVAGLLAARGEYLCWWCDDERADPDHLSRMVGLLEARGVDFAYPLVRFWRPHEGPEGGFDIGTDPPRHGQFTHSVFRADVLKKAMPAWNAHPVDWTLCEAWMEAHATWAMLPEITFSHRADH
jgi:glycosyltransferase involved in cell wall biosynthesis